VIGHLRLTDRGLLWEHCPDSAIRRGITKVNIDTDMRIAFTAHVRKALAERPEEIDPRRVLGPGGDAIAAVVREKIKLFGSEGKAG
jgi:fructose-bisphosphate aldolase class II